MNKTPTTRRSFLAALAAVFAVSPARAWTPVSGEDVGIVPATGNWAVLEHVTDGTDPSTALIAPPRFTPEMRKLAGSDITLTGYLQPVSTGFGGKREYLLSRNAFHCAYCYPFGRGSLALATIEGHVPSSTKKVTLRGTLALQEKDPSDFYFQMKDAKIVG